MFNCLLGIDDNQLGDLLGHLTQLVCGLNVGVLNMRPVNDLQLLLDFLKDVPSSLVLRSRRSPAQLHCHRDSTLHLSDFSLRRSYENSLDREMGKRSKPKWSRSRSHPTDTCHPKPAAGKWGNPMGNSGDLETEKSR